MYKFARFLFVIYCHLFNVTEIHGRENIPADGPLIIYANHVSAFDVILLAITFRRPIYFMAKKELFKIPVAGWVVKKLNAFPVDRDHVDLTAVMTAMSVLKRGEQMGIFPEGTRSKKHGGSAPAKGGVALFATRCKTDVLPVHLAYKRNLMIFNRFTVTVGKPIPYAEIPVKSRDDYETAGAWLMEKLYEL